MKLRSVIPVLIKTNNFLTIVDLAMRKVKYLQGVGGQTNDIVACYDIILQLFTALDQSINH